MIVQEGEWALCFSELSTCANPSQSPQNPISPTCMQVLRPFLCGSFSYRSVHNPAKEQGLRSILSLSLPSSLSLSHSTPCISGISQRAPILVDSHNDTAAHNAYARKYHFMKGGQQRVLGVPLGVPWL